MVCPRETPFLGPLPSQAALLAPVSSLPSSPVLCFQPPRSPSPAWAAEPPRPPLPRWRVSLCLTGSRLRRALRLLLTSTQLLREEGRRAARGWIRHSRFGVCSQLPGNSVLMLPPLSNYSSAPQGPKPRSAHCPFLSRCISPGYLATLSFPASGVALHSVAFQLPLATSCPLPLQSL